MTHEKIAATFDEWAGNGRSEAMQEGHGDVVRQVLAELRIGIGHKTLDLGCGNGWATRLIADAAPGASAVGIDVAPAMIARAESLHDLTSRARYQVGTFEELEFEDAHFERVFSMEALYYAVDLERTLAEIFRVLKPGGAADVVIDRFKESTHTANWNEMLGVDMHFLGESEWRAAFARVGFDPVTLRRVIDSRGPGDETDFQASAHAPDWQTRVELHAAGSLWIHGTKPA